MPGVFFGSTEIVDVGDIVGGVDVQEIYVGATKIWPGGAPPFSPPDLSGLQFWFDASDAGTITDAGGGLVSQWDDKSVNGRDISQVLTASQPLISTDGGFDSILFDGTDDTLQNSAITMNWASGTMYVIGRLVSYQNINAIISLNESSAQLYWAGTRLTDEWRLQMPANGDPFFSRSFAPHFWMRHEHVSAVSAVITDDLGNTATDLSGIPTISNIDELVVGALVPQGDGLNMHVHEIIGYNRILTGGEQTQLEEYISSKWGFL